MAQKASFSFNFSFKRRMHLSVILLVVLTVGTVISYVAVEMVKARRIAAQKTLHTPKLAMENWHKDLLAYHAKFASFPADLRELEIQIWNGGNASLPTKLANGNRFYVLDNYLYIYNGGKKSQICNVWAVPLDEYRNEFNTVFWLLTPREHQEWKGAAIAINEINFIPADVNPTDVLMARFGLSKQLPDGKNAPKSAGGGFGPPSFRFGQKQPK